MSGTNHTDVENDTTMVGHPFSGATRFDGRLSRAWGARALAPWLAAHVDPARLASIAPPAADRSFWNDSLAGRLGPLLTRVAADAAQPWPQPLAHDWTRYWRDGVRTAYEDRVRARTSRLNRVALAACLEPDRAHLEALADGILLVCEQSTWCWVAHDDCHDVDGSVFTDVDRPFLDLGAGEVVAQLGWIDHLLGAELDRHCPGLRARIRTEARRRVFDPFSRRHDWHWLGLDGHPHNWSAWIHANLIGAAITLVDDPQERALVLQQALDGLDRYVTALPADGAIDEGYAYWWEGAARVLESVDLLAVVTADGLDPTGLPVLHSLTRFPMAMHIAGEHFVDFADCPERPPVTQAWQTLWHWGRLLGDDHVRAFAASFHGAAPLPHEDQGLGRVLRALGDPSWTGAPTGAAPVAHHSWLPSTQVLTVHQHEREPGGLFLAVKGGHNGENHNHLDVGSVIVSLDGAPVLVDAGKTTYTALSFTPRRYEIRAMQSGWHNVPSPAGLDQGVGADFGAREVRPDPDGRGLRMRLEKAYPGPAQLRWRRHARLDPVLGEVLVEDEWQGAGPGTAVHWLLAGEVTLDGNAVHVAGPEGALATVDWQGAVSAELETWALTDPSLGDIWGARLTRLSLTTDAEHGTLTTRVRAR